MISSSAVNANFSDIATGLSNALTRDNQAGMTAALRIVDGTVGAPGIQFGGDTNTGFRRSASDEFRWVGGGVDRMYIDAAGKMFQLGAIDVAGLANFQAAITALAGITIDSSLNVRRSNAGVQQIIGRFSNDAGAPELYFDKSRNTALGAQTIVQSGDVLGLKLFRGSDGSAFQNAATIQAVVDGTPGANDMPGALVLSTTADGAAAVTERMAIRQSGLIQIPNRSAPLIQLAGTGFVDFSEISTPANPAADVARFYCRDSAGAPTLFFRNSAGVESALGGSASGGLQLLNSGVVSVAASLDIVLTTFTGYRGLRFVFSNFVPVTDDVEFWCRLSTDGGSSFAATGYSFVASYNRDSVATAGTFSSAAANQISLACINTAGLAVSNVAAEGGVSGALELLNQTATGIWPKVTYLTSSVDATGNTTINSGTGILETAQDTDAIRFLFESGNISTGNWALYGYA